MPPLPLQVIGQAFGNAAMIVASGKKGYRYALPNSRIMTCPPRMNRAFGNVSNCMIKANELENATQVGVCRRWVLRLSRAAGMRNHSGQIRVRSKQHSCNYL